MTSRKASELPILSSLSLDDRLYVVDNPSGTPGSYGVTTQTLLNTYKNQTDIVTLQSTDIIPVGRVGSDVPYRTTPLEIQSYISSNITGFTNPITLGIKGATEGAFHLNTLDANIGWHFTSYQYTWFGHPDEALIYGWNRNAPAPNGYDDLTKPAIYEGFEHDYYADAVNHYAEWYIGFRNGDGTERRPLQSSIGILDNLVSNKITGKIDFYTSGGSPMFQMTDGVGGVLASYGNAIRFMTNNVPALTQMNATGTGFVNLACLDNTNTVLIGQGGYKVSVTTQDLYVGTDAIHGLVLRERTAPWNYFRIYLNGGVLGIEAV